MILNGFVNFLPVKYILKSDLSKFSTANNLRYMVLVYVIGWGAVVFGINCASNAGKKL